METKGIVSIVLAVLLALLTAAAACAEEQVWVVAEGEAPVIGKDIQAASREAMARARWAALEKAVAAAISLEGYIQDFTLLEELMRSQLAAAIKSSTTIKEMVGKETVGVGIKACVVLAKAQELLTTLALNDAVAVFIPARLPTGDGDSEVRESNSLSDAIVEALSAENFTVIDVAPLEVMKAADVNKALTGNPAMAVRSMVYRLLANVFVIGKADFTVIAKKGEYIGKNVKMPLCDVNVRLTYRILARNAKTGVIELLAAGMEQAEGLGPTLAEAVEAGMQEVGGASTAGMVEKIAAFLEASKRRLTVNIDGIPDRDAALDVKEMLLDSPWVTDVEEQGLGKFTVVFTEHPAYLANALQVKRKFDVISVMPYSLNLKYRR